MMDPPTKGMRGEKFAMSGTECNGAFDATFRFDPGSGRMNVTIAGRDLTGLDPTDVIAGIYVLTVLSPPCRMVLQLRNGPRLGEPSPIPVKFLDIPDQTLEICEALATIQSHSFVPIAIPDLTTTMISEAREWSHVARLLRGDAVEITWEYVDVEPKPGIEFRMDAFTIATQKPLTIKIGAIEINLGYQLVHLEAAQVDPINQPTPGTVRLIPAASNVGSVRWIGEGSPSLRDGV